MTEDGQKELRLKPHLSLAKLAVSFLQQLRRTDDCCVVVWKALADSHCHGCAHLVKVLGDLFLAPR